MRKNQMKYYKYEFKITDRERYKSVRDSERLHVVYKFDNNKNEEARDRLDRTLENGSIEDILEAQDFMNNSKGYAPEYAIVEYINAIRIYKVGELRITEDTYINIDQWEDIPGLKK